MKTTVSIIGPGVNITDYAAMFKQAEDARLKAMRRANDVSAEKWHENYNERYGKPLTTKGTP